MEIPFLLKINNVNIPNIKSFKLGPNKLWSDAGRNMSGDLVATFIGIFPKLEIEFAPMFAEDLRTITNLIDQSTFLAAFWDERIEAIRAAEYYAGDYKYSLLRKDIKLYDSFQVDLIPFKKQT